MINSRGVLAVVRFLGRRAVAGNRLFWWCLLAGFPAGLTLLLRVTGGSQPPPPEVWLFITFAFIPGLTCVAGTFLWVTAAVQSEIDARTWIYLATRANGTTSLLLGNYLVAVMWTIAASLVALALMVPLTRSNMSWHNIWLYVFLVLLSAPAYASIYALLGVIFIKRAMFVAITYTLVSELIVGLLPAMINQFTVQYRLRSIWYHWLEMRSKGSMPRDFQMFFSDVDPGFHILILAGITIGLLSIAVWIVHRKETTLGAESDF